MRIDKMDEREELIKLIMEMSPEEREELLKTWNEMKKEASA